MIPILIGLGFTILLVTFDYYVTQYPKDKAEEEHLERMRIELDNIKLNLSKIRAEIGKQRAV